ncbi:MAG TPA: phosphoribosylamine--glycine ligase [Clostridia bacterium]|nr:phosphoribosylamine--glycine ligase [Clostridia bacterium]
MKILVVGGGGREHAIIWKLSQSSKTLEIYCAPGNGGISELAQCIDIRATDIDNMVEFAIEESMDLVIVTPDDPLAQGMVDALEDAGIKAFGPRANAAIIEGSKVFAKEFMKKYEIPTAGYEVFEDFDKALSYLEGVSYPLVLKADGLALGKGVFIAQDSKEARQALKVMMVDNVFGSAGAKVVIEEFLIGPEVSLLAFTDGKTIVPMVSSQDHKRAYDGDQGPNTGGMGTFSPSRAYTPEIAQFVEKRILKPTIEGMNKEGRPFKGIIFLGIMLTQQGPKLLEYNARFGDPETQVVLPRLGTDLLDILLAIVEEKLDEVHVRWNENAAVCVVLASGGYPESFTKGYPIHGIHEVNEQEDIMIFHGGTKKENGQYLTNGGRVLGLTAVSKDLDTAMNKVYDTIEGIQFKDMYYRKDIGRE